MNKLRLLANDKEIRFFSILTGFLALLLTLSFFVESRINRGDISVPAKAVVAPFDDVEILAKGAYVYDVRTDTVLYAKNPDKRLPLASLTKMMSALVAHESTPSYGTVNISKEALSAEGDSGLLVGERWSLRALLDFSLVSSSNDGMRAVALALGAIHNSNATAEEVMDDFVGQMNSKASELGLRNTYYFNETGLDESLVKNGAYGSAEDMAKLMKYIVSYEKELLEGTKEEVFVTSSLDDFVHVASNTNSITNTIPGLLASKTGYTDISGGNLVVAFDPEIGRPIVVAVLGSTLEGRFEDVEKLVARVMQGIEDRDR